jgi:hypothetical protein
MGNTDYYPQDESSQLALSSTSGIGIKLLMVGEESGEPIVKLS